jgi:hypothetical protein
MSEGGPNGAPRLHEGAPPAPLVEPLVDVELLLEVDPPKPPVPVELDPEDVVPQSQSDHMLSAPHCWPPLQSPGPTQARVSPCVQAAPPPLPAAWIAMVVPHAATRRNARDSVAIPAAADFIMARAEWSAQRGAGQANLARTVER